MCSLLLGPSLSRVADVMTSFRLRRGNDVLCGFAGASDESC